MSNAAVAAKRMRRDGMEMEAESGSGADAAMQMGYGCETGRSLLIASLDQPEMPEDFVEDDHGWGFSHHRRESMMVGGPTQGKQPNRKITPEELQLGMWGRIAQMLPILVVMVLSTSKVRDAFARNAGTVSTRGVLEIFAALVLYCISGPAVILVNKHIMRHHKFHFPILLASLGNVILLLATRGAVALGWYKLETQSLDWTRYLKVVVPINIFNFLTQTLGMYAFLFISVPEIQILKSVTIVMVLCFAWLLVNEKVNKVLVSSVVIIAAGVCLSAIFDGEAKLGVTSPTKTIIGVVLMISASTFEAAKTVFSQVLMDKMPLFDGIYHSSPTFVLIAAMFVGCMEAKGLAHYNYTAPVIGLLLTNALVTGVIVLSSFWFVKLAGAVTLKVVTQARSIGLILCSVIFFGEFCTSLQYLGYTVTLIGMGMFDYAKQVIKSEESKVGSKAGAKAVA